jgi:hypothetical protein
MMYVECDSQQAHKRYSDTLLHLYAASCLGASCFWLTPIPSWQGTQADGVAYRRHDGKVRVTMATVIQR